MKKNLTLGLLFLSASFLLASCIFDPAANDGSLAGERRDLGYREKPKEPVKSINGLYKVAEGYERGAWNCWNNDGQVATLTDGSDGGLRITSVTRPCGGTYWGVNLAAGTEVGKNKDLDGKDFTSVEFELKGTTPINTLYFFADEYGDYDGTTLDSNGGKEWYKFSHYTESAAAYNDKTWTKFTIPMTWGECTDSMFTVFTIGGDGGWIEIRNIDWKDKDGKSVVPAYK